MVTVVTCISGELYFVSLYFDFIVYGGCGVLYFCYKFPSTNNQDGRHADMMQIEQGSMYFEIDTSFLNTRGTTAYRKRTWF